MKHRTRLILPLTLAVLLMPACRPVLAIGWGEFLLFLFLLGVLILPPLFRFWRKWRKLDSVPDDKEKE